MTMFSWVCHFPFVILLQKIAFVLVLGCEVFLSSQIKYATSLPRLHKQFIHTQCFIIFPQQGYSHFRFGEGMYLVYRVLLCVGRKRCRADMSLEDFVKFL